MNESSDTTFAEQNILLQRNHHYCKGHTNLSNKFQKLVLCDWAEMYFSQIMALRDITNDIICQNQIREFI